MTIYCSTTNLDLTQIPFSRALSRLMVFFDLNIPDPDEAVSSVPLEDRNRPLLYASLTPQPGRRARRRGLLRLSPMRDGQELPFNFRAMAQELVIFTDAGSVRIAFERGGAMRLRGDVALSLRSAEHSGGAGQRLEYGPDGAVRFERLAGAFRLHTQDGQAEILLEPEPGGVFDFALCEGDSTYSGEAFDDVVADAAADFAAWQSRYGPLRPEYREILELSAYFTWICLQNDNGQLSLLARRNGSIRITPWEQGLAALSMVGDKDCAASFLRNIPIPGNVNYDDPPLQGVAALRLMDSGLDLRDVYEPLAQYFLWWKENRYDAHYRLPVYVRCHKRGFCRVPGLEEEPPILSPDLPAYLALVAEALQCMAISLDKPDEAAEWARMETSLLDNLIAELWNGKVFVSKKGEQGEVFDSQSSLQLVPLILGERLPIKVLDKLVADIERDQLCERGVIDFRWSSGVYLPAQVVFMLAFKLIERAEVATSVARGVIRYVSEFGFEPQSYAYGKKEDPREQYAAPCSIWSSVVATVVLALASMME